MSSNYFKSRDAAPAQSIPHTELTRTRAEILAAEAAANAAQRRVELEELRSERKSPEERVRAWERLHGLALPLIPGHPILDLIAVKTQLMMHEVEAVQRNDAVRRAARLAAQGR